MAGFLAMRLWFFALTFSPIDQMATEMNCGLGKSSRIPFHTR